MAEQHQVKTHGRFVRDRIIILFILKKAQPTSQVINYSYFFLLFIEEETLKVPDVSIVETSAELLYGLIHQRYIITRQGLQQMVCINFYPSF